MRAALLVRVVLRLSRAGVGDGEAAVGRGDDFEPGAVGPAFEIGNQIRRAVVGGVRVFRGVELPEVFEAGTFMDGLPGFRTAGLVRAVVHDGYARVDCIDEGS